MPGMELVVVRNPQRFVADVVPNTMSYVRMSLPGTILCGYELTCYCWTKSLLNLVLSLLLLAKPRGWSGDNCT